MATYDDFLKLEMRVGEIIEVQDFPRAHKPAYKVRVDFGAEIGTKWSSVQAKNEYSQDQLLHLQVVCLINLPPKNIAGFQSEVLVLGVPAEDGSLSLLTPSRTAHIGGKMY